MAQLQVNGLIKRFGSQTVLNNVSFTVDDGEFFVLLGPSGGGKSTLLRILCGLEAPDSGHVSLGGRDITLLPPRQRNLGMVFQDYGLYPNMNVFDNIAYGLQARSVDKSEIQARIDVAAKNLGLSDKLRLGIVDLSGGEQQRVALARALVKDADAYLYDEPLANLDPKLRLTARRDILRVHREKNKPSVYVTHDQNEAFALGDRIAVIGPGGILHQVGAGETLTDAPANTFVAGFVGTPAMNILHAELSDSAGLVYACGDGFKLQLPEDLAQRAKGAKKITLGIKPSDLYVSQDASVGLKARVLKVNPLIGETECRVDVGSQKLTALLSDDAAAMFSVGEVLALACSPRSVHLFDYATGEALI